LVWNNNFGLDNATMVPGVTTLVLVATTLVCDKTTLAPDDAIFVLEKAILVPCYASSYQRLATSQLKATKQTAQHKQ
jgi:hypothetical protein